MILEKIKELGNHFAFYTGVAVNWVFSHELYENINKVFGMVGVVASAVYTCILLYVQIRDKIINNKK